MSWRGRATAAATSFAAAWRCKDANAFWTMHSMVLKMSLSYAKLLSCLAKARHSVIVVGMCGGGGRLLLQFRVSLVGPVTGA